MKPLNLQSFKTVGFGILITTALQVYSSCRKDVPVTPSSSTTQNSIPNFSFVVNGRYTTQCSKDTALYNGFMLYLMGAANVDFDQNEVELYANVKDTGNYLLSVKSSGQYAHFYNEVIDAAPADSYTDSSHTGTLHVTNYNASTRSVSGTFSFRFTQNFYGDTTVNGSFGPLTWH